MTWIRLGWIKLRCPIRPLDESLVSSLLSSLHPPLRPAIHSSRSFSRLSSNNRAMLTCGMRLPLADELVHRRGSGARQQSLPKRFVAEHLCQFRENLQVQIGGAIGYQQHEYEAHRLAVGRIERYRLLHSDERAYRFLQALDPPVGYGDALSQAGGAQLFAGEQTVEYLAAGDVVIVLEEQSDLLENALLAAGVELQNDIRKREQFGDQVHVRSSRYCEPLKTADGASRSSPGLVFEGIAAVAVLEGLLLVLDDGPIELVDQSIGGGIHVGRAALAMDVLAENMHARLDLVIEFFDREYHVDVDDVVEMMRNTLELARNVIADGRCDFQVMPGEVQIHPSPPLAGAKTLDGFPEVDGEYLQRLAILGHGATRNDDPLLRQYLRDLPVRERLAGVFRHHQLLDQRADGGAGRRSAGVGRDVTSEEVLELVDAARRMHVFLRRHARNGGFMQVQRLGNLSQHERAHRDLAVLEEVALPVDDGLRYAKYRFEPLLHVLDEPLRFLQLTRKLLGSAVPVALHYVGVKPVDAQPRHRVGIERSDPHALHFLHYDIRHDIARLLGREVSPWPRIHAGDEFLHRAQRRVVTSQKLLQLSEI